MVLNQIGQVSWLVWKSYMLLVPGIFLGGHHQQPVWWTDHSVCFSVFKMWSWACLDSCVDCPSNCGCEVDHLCCWKISNLWGDQCFHNKFSGRVFMLNKCRLSFFCIFSAPQSSDSYKDEPIHDNCFKWIDRRFVCQVQQSCEHLSSDGTLLSSNIFFSLPG